MATRSAKRARIDPLEADKTRMLAICRELPAEGATSEPLYGEISIASLKSIFEFFISHCGFDSSSSVMDIGSGVNRPNFYATMAYGVRTVGIEMSAHRHGLAQIYLNKLRTRLPDYPWSKCCLINANVASFSVEGFQELATSHVMMFDIGFPREGPSSPYPMLAKLWNNSAAHYLVSFQREAFILDSGFDVELIGSLKGMKAGKSSFTARIFKRKEDPPLLPDMTVDSEGYLVFSFNGNVVWRYKFQK